MLTASLRSQVNSANRTLFKDVSPERCVCTECAHEGVLTHTLQGVCRLCRKLRHTALFRVRLPWLIISFPSFVRASFRSCDSFPKLAYESEKSSQGKARLNATAYINIVRASRIIIPKVRSSVIIQSTMTVGCKQRSNATRTVYKVRRKGRSYMRRRVPGRVCTWYEVTQPPNVSAQKSSIAVIQQVTS